MNARALAQNLDRVDEQVAQYPALTLWAVRGSPVVCHGYFIKARDALYERLAKYQPDWRRFGEPTAGGHSFLPREPTGLQLGV